MQANEHESGAVHIGVQARHRYRTVVVVDAAVFTFCKCLPTIWCSEQCARQRGRRRSYRSQVFSISMFVFFPLYSALAAPNRCHALSFIFVSSFVHDRHHAAQWQSLRSIHLFPCHCSEWLHLSLLHSLSAQRFVLEVSCKKPSTTRIEFVPMKIKSCLTSWWPSEAVWDQWFMRNRSNLILPSLSRLYRHQRLW